MKKIPVPVIIYALLLLYTAAPIISVLICGGLASLFGCHVDEGSIHPCRAGGADIGGLLYTLGVSGWFMLVTLPTGGVALLIYTIGLLSAKAYARRNKPQ